MQPLYDSDAPKKPTNLTVNSDLLEKCRAMNINLSATLEAALRQKLAELAGNSWASENSNEIAAYNESVEDSGCFGDELREF
jgi:antitoxin CcdA